MFYNECYLYEIFASGVIWILGGLIVSKTHVVDNTLSFKHGHECRQNNTPEDSGIVEQGNEENVNIHMKCSIVIFMQLLRSTRIN